MLSGDFAILNENDIQPSKASPRLIMSQGNYTQKNDQSPNMTATGNPGRATGQSFNKT